jgi:beta-alanine--pyruvate transaminase
MSVGGIDANKKQFASALLPGVDHLPHTHDLAHNAFSRGQPEWGAHLADELEAIVARHGAETIAAVIVEPLAGSAGVLVPPKGYLERLRAICDQHGILLIFDEVITGFGRLAAPFGATRFGVIPDMITVAKGITNGSVPMGAAFIRQGIHDAVVSSSNTPIELFHGYTYSGHPLACAAAMATLDVYRDEALFSRALSMAPYLEDSVHALRGLPHVIDIRNLGFVAAIELEPRPGAVGARGFETFLKCFEAGVLIRMTGDIIAISPPLIAEREHVDRIVGTLAEVLKG